MNHKDTLFVTGGTGHLGHSLLPCLVESGYQVRALTRHPERHPWLKPLGVEVIGGDVADAPLIEQAVQGCRYVVHAGGLFSFWGQPELFERTNVQGTANVMEAALRAGVEKLIHISTIALIGHPLPGRVVDETHPPAPADPYQHSKLKGEQLALDYQCKRGLPAVVLRPGAFYGPYSRYAFNRLFIEDPLKGLRIQVNGGRHVIFPVYTGDVSAGIVSALRQGVPGEIYNLCGDPITHREANRIVSEEAGISTFRVNVPGWGMIVLASLWTAISRFTRVEPYYPINLRSYVFNDWRVSSEKARSALGFTSITFREGVRRTLDWYRESGLWKPRRKA